MKYIHIDPSLCHFAGHHWGLAKLCCEAARESGYDVTIIANRSFQNCAESIGDKFKFRYLNSSPTTLFSANNSGSIRWPIELSLTRLSIPEIAGLAKGMVRGPSPSKVLRACDSLAMQLLEAFESMRLSSGDLTFYATSNEFELASHARAISRLGTEIAWRACFYFHYGIFPSKQSHGFMTPKRRLNILGKSMGRSISQIRKFQTNYELLGATSSIARQLSDQLASPVEELHWPVDLTRFLSVKPDTQTDVTSDNKIIRISIAAFREEQGLKLVPTIITELCTHLKSVSFQLSVPCSEQVRSELQQLLSPEILAKTDFPSHPFKPGDYPKWINATDIMLLPYDTGKYNERLSGIAIESACMGKILIVPKGTLLSGNLQNKWSSQLKTVHSTETGTWVGVAFEGIGELVAQIKLVCSNYSLFKSNARLSSILVRDFHSPHRFFNRIATTGTTSMKK